MADVESLGESARLFSFAILEAVAAARLALGVVVAPVGIGGLDSALRNIHLNASNQRAWATRTGEHEVSARYGPEPETTSGGLSRLRVTLEDPARARDVDWHLLNPVIGSMSSLLPAAFILHGLLGMVTVGAVPWAEVSQQYMGIWVHADSFDGGQVVVTALSGIQIVLAPPLARLLQRSHRRWVGTMLATDTEALQARVQSLATSRMTALDMQDAEIRRIERDLHDGAQARLVTIGMTVTQASRLLRHDTDAALALLDQVKTDSADGLDELRSLIRGIRPPVLADRGLTDALRALAASSPIDAVVRSSVHERLVSPIESAIYFAVSELITNATKHSSATQISINVSRDAEAVVVEVSDDGLGGAEGQELPDGGLAGIRRRLAPFDGTLDLLSPVGGGTFAILRIPVPAG